MANPKQAAVNWARAQVGSNVDAGMCLTFVYDAYLKGAHLDTKGGMRTNSQTTAYQFWQNFPRLHHPPTNNPPLGAFVFWGPRPGYPAGHVALSIGGGQVVSTLERTTPTVHVFRVSERNGMNYLGYMMPPGTR